MMRNPVAAVIGVALICIVAVGAVAAATSWDHFDRDRKMTVEVTGPNGQALPDNTTVVVNANDGRGGRSFFPFFPLFPLFFIFGIFFLCRFIFFRGRFGGCGWRNDAWNKGVPPWFDQWHLRAHEIAWDQAAKKADHAAEEPE